MIPANFELLKHIEQHEIDEVISNINKTICDDLINMNIKYI